MRRSIRLGYENFAKVCREYILLNNSNNLWLLKTRLFNKIQKSMALYTTETGVIACWRQKDKRRSFGVYLRSP